MNTDFVMEYHHLPILSPLDAATGTHRWTLIYLPSAVSTSVATGGSRIYLIPPGQDVHWVQPLPGRAAGVCCQFQACPQWISWLHQLQTPHAERPLLIQDGRLCQELQYVLERLMEYGDRADHPGYRQLTFHLLSEVLLLLAMHAGTDHQHSDPRIEEVQQYLQRHYTEDIRVEQLAQLVCLSPSRLSHLYKQHIGETIMDTVLRLRLEQAQQLLCSTSRYIGEIAYEVGFNSQTYFTCKFTRHFGISPSLYRSSFFARSAEEEPAYYL
ncbi:helix-turn-helix domain-containing protein [Paenibacillus sp. WLX2291]|uniref:AraC family transcriptional regulator n=1 Tax=Paenibacillus sp. WLX2291 TaxID=3296934 RepID=UPI0039842C80